jgi:hypothetical protein
MLRPHLRRDSVTRRACAREFVFSRDVDQRVPVARRVDAGRSASVRCSTHGQRESPSRRRSNWRRVNEAIPSNPDVEGRFGREVGYQVTTLVIGHDDLAEPGRRLRCFGDDPHACFRSARARDYARDVISVDRDLVDRAALRLLRRQPHRRGCHRDGHRKQNSHSLVHEFVPRICVVLSAWCLRLGPSLVWSMVHSTKAKRQRTDRNQGPRTLAPHVESHAIAAA